MQEPFARLAAQGAMIERLATDSRRCAPGVAFLAYPGEAADGRAFIGDALARGAAAVLWEEEGHAWDARLKAPNAPVRGLKSRSGALAHEFYGRPSESLWVCGVTGTNGKTSCSHWLAAALGAHGVRSGIVGTLGSGFAGALADAANTTPDAVELQRMLKEMRDAGAQAVAMEVSSHGLVQERVSAVRFSCALFTNLSQDHLDYHGTMQAYGAAKARLFDFPGLECAVINLDDEFGATLARKLAGRGQRVIGITLGGKPAAMEHVAGSVIEGSRLALDTSWGRAEARLDVVGRFNIANALGVLGCLLARGVALDEAARLLEALPPVPGRMQAVAQEPLVVIDYAHTPDALEKVLQALRPVADARGGRLVAVFGAGGDRDPGKRPLMGAAVARFADRIVVTSDNPRGEDPLAIIAQVARGIPGAHEAEADREQAIRRALAGASPRDVVLVAGKGHEAYQEIAGRRLPFSDAAAVKRSLER